MQRMNEESTEKQSKENNRHLETIKQMDHENEIEKGKLELEKDKIINERETNKQNHEETLKTMDHNQEKEMEQIRAGFKDKELEKQMKMEELKMMHEERMKKQELEHQLKMLIMEY